MTILWILPIIAFLIYMYSPTFRLSVNSLFGATKSKKRSSSSSSDYDFRHSGSYNSSYDPYQDKRSYRNNYEKYNRSQSSSYSSSYDSGDKINYHSYIRKIYTDMKDDFVRANYTDKFILDDPNILVGYIFENGRTIKLKNNRNLEDVLNGKGTRITLEYTDISQFMTYYKGLVELAVRRPSDSSFGGGRRSYQQQYQDYFNRKTQSSRPKDNTIYTTEQLEYQEKFWKLKKINDLRMKQLDGMSEKDPNRVALVNEVNVVKRKMKKFYDKSGLPPRKNKKK